MSQSILLLLAAAVANCAEAATIRGIVLDHYTGRPLARTVVTLESIQGYGSAKTSIRTGSTGQFVFLSLNPGAYLLSAARPSFATWKYGQKFWNAPGAPIFLTEASAPYLDLRLHRLAAISGTIWDENEIGIADQEVYAYRNTKPPTLSARGRTDDRGVYRIGGLNPGQYLIRAGSKQLDEETAVTPTFYKDSVSVDEARIVDVELDQQVADINVRPNFGRLLQLAGRVVPIPDHCAGSISVTLISDMGRTTVSTPIFSFDQLSQGNYELLAEFTPVSRSGCDHTAAYQAFNLARDEKAKILDLYKIPAVQLSLEDKDGKTVDPSLVTVVTRHKDLSGEGTPFEIKSGASVLPGRWEMTASARGNLYPVSMTLLGAGAVQRGGRGDAWNEFLVPRGGGALKVLVGTGAASLRGRVTKSISDPAIGAPVYLEAIDPSSQKRLSDLRKTLTDTRGDYRFVGLTPGSYRIVSSFEFEDPDERMMESVRAKLVVVSPGTESTHDLDLYTTP
jgi:hypothetical protein